MIADLSLTCSECGREFAFSADEQSFYQAQGFKTAPRRCRSCRRTKRQADRGHVAPTAGTANQRRYDTTCSGCGLPTRVPFRPDPARPAFCRTCYSGRRAQQS